MEQAETDAAGSAGGGKAREAAAGEAGAEISASGAPAEDRSGESGTSIGPDPS